MTLAVAEEDGHRGEDQQRTSECDREPAGGGGNGQLAAERAVAAEGRVPLAVVLPRRKHVEDRGLVRGQWLTRDERIEEDEGRGRDGEVRGDERRAATLP